VFAGPPAVTNQQTRTQQSTFSTAREVPVWTRQLFRGCGIKDCDFSGANLYDCDLRSVDLSGSKFVRANLQRAQMQGCNVGSVDLAACNLVDTNLTGCIVDDATRFPEGYPLPIGVNNRDEKIRQQEKNDRKAGYVILSLMLGVAVFLGGIIALAYITTPAPPSFYVRPSSGVKTDGPISVWQIPEGEWVPIPNRRYFIVEISSFAREVDLPSSDLTLKIGADPSSPREERSFVEKLCLVVLGNPGRNGDVFSFSSGVNEIHLAVPVRVHKGRSQLRFSWPKELEGKWRVSRVLFSVSSKCLNSKGSVSVSLD
jgi:hypothetical protein